MFQREIFKLKTKGCLIYAQAQAISVEKDASQLNFNKNIKCKNSFICGIELNTKCPNDCKYVMDIMMIETSDNYDRFFENRSETKWNFENFKDKDDKTNKMVNTIDKMVDMINKMVDMIDDMHDMIEPTDETQEVTNESSDNTNKVAKMTIVTSYKMINETNEMLNRTSKTTNKMTDETAAKTADASKPTNKMAETNDGATEDMKNNNPNDVMTTTDANEALNNKNEETSDYQGHYGNTDNDGVDNNVKNKTKDNGDAGYTSANDKTPKIVTEKSPINKEEKSNAMGGDDGYNNAMLGHGDAN